MRSSSVRGPQGEGSAWLRYSAFRACIAGWTSSPVLVHMDAERTMPRKATTALKTWPVSVRLTCALIVLALGIGGCEGIRAVNKKVQNALKTDRYRFLGPHQPIAAPDRPRIWPIRESATAADITDDLLPNAVFPVDADYVFSEEDYVIGPNDVLDIGIMDLFQIGAETNVRRQVEGSGFIDLPLLTDRIRAEGLTGQELRQIVMDAYSPDLLRDPRVTVVVAARRQQTFSIVGAVGAPGTYDIPRRDTRLWDALALARDVTNPTVRYIYIIRQLPATPIEQAEAPAAPQTQPDEPQTRPEEPSEELPSTLPPLPGQDPDDSTPSPFDEPQPEEILPVLPGGIEEGSDLPPALPDLDALPGPGEETPEVPPMLPTETVDASDALSNDVTVLLRYVETVDAPVAVDDDQTGSGETTFLIPALADNGDVADNGDSADSGDMPADQTNGEVADTNDPFGWGRAARTDLSRVIAINLAKLRDGDPRMNIVIRANDIIRVPQIEAGEFYVGGEVQRPGVYSLTGRKLTVKQALIAAGNLSPLAWPSNSVLVRRIGDSQEQFIPLDIEKIFRNEEPDIFLRANDVIEVGTHPAAAFMAVIRNAFRMSYGFGFIYDRNFAEPVDPGMDSRRFTHW